MSFNWSDFLTLAVSLQTAPALPGPEEAALRTAISRAYYAAFRSALDLAESREGYQPRHSGEDHRGVIAHYSGRADRAHQKIGTTLDRLRANRRKADYDDTIGNLPNTAAASVQMAGKVLGLLSTI
jgi:uncharacterized protein (UPF0332 family)